MTDNILTTINTQSIRKYCGKIVVSMKKPATSKHNFYLSRITPILLVHVVEYGLLIPFFSEM